MPSAGTRRGARSALARRLGHEFADPDLLEIALTHRSWCAENDGSLSNERLEFLGDAVLGLVVADQAYREYPDLPEGSLAKLRASVVSAATLGQVAQEIALGEALRLGRGEELSGGRDKPSIQSDAIEAVLGAVYLDGGLDAARGVIVRLLGDRIQVAGERPGTTDHKTRLQELAARRCSSESPVYTMDEEGPDHAKWFFATVSLAGRVVGSGEGRSKKRAQQAAARDAWRRLSTDGDEASQ